MKDSSHAHSWSGRSVWNVTGPTAVTRPISTYPTGPLADGLLTSAVWSAATRASRPHHCTPRRCATRAAPSNRTSGAPEVTFTFHLTQGVGPTKPVMLEMPA